MRRLWDAIAMVVITAIFINAFMALVKPYMLPLLIALIVVLIAKRAWSRSRYW